MHAYKIICRYETCTCATLIKYSTNLYSTSKCTDQDSKKHMQNFVKA